MPSHNYVFIQLVVDIHDDHCRASAPNWHATSVPMHCCGAVVGARLADGIGLDCAPSQTCSNIAMLNPKTFEDIAARVSAVLSNTPAAEVEKNVKALLSSAFGRLDLVPREEFDVQREVLAKTREKLTALEARVAELEALKKNK
jgi:BMFP domain-containing protein YqiC